ncbi:MAG: carboxypeptidase-like regulatory domain-containing protein [Thermoplasmatota archaeon]
MRAPWMTFLLVATALAGCSDSGGGGGDAGDPLVDQGLDDIEVEATATTGVIRGVVVDAAIRPIADAEVSVLVANQEPRVTMTTESGAFGFSDLPPGTYFVKASKQGYFEAQASTEVVAGVDEPLALKIQLEVNADAIAYVQEYVFNGFIECSTTFLAVCGLGNTASNLAIGSNITNDHFIQYWDVDAPPEWVQSEMVWQSTQSISDRMWLWHSKGDLEHNFDGNFPDPHVTGPSPLVIFHNATQAAEAGVGETASLAIRVFSGDVDGTGPPDAIENCYGVPGQICFANGPGFTIQQEFKVFSHLFHNYLPPEGWRFTDSPPPAAP